MLTQLRDSQVEMCASGSTHAATDLAKYDGEGYQLQQVPILDITTSDTNSDSEVDLREIHQKKYPIMSSKQCMADSMMLHKVTWPHELVYTTDGNPMVYNKLTIPLVISDNL